MVTGISGFVGSHPAKHLSSNGWNISGDDLRSPRMECDFYSGDLSDLPALEVAVKKSAPDVIFHLAGILKSHDYEGLYRAYVLETISLLETILAVGVVPLVVIASSSTVYSSGNGSTSLTQRFCPNH